MPSRDAPVRGRRTLPAIPAFTLYGEAGAPPAEDMLHLESLQSRSRLHRWEIEPHVHRRLHQVIWLRAGPAEVSIDGRQTRGIGPLLVVVPAGAVHGFRFDAETDGQVLTLSPRAVLEGDRAGAGDALQGLFARPRLVPVPEVEVSRLAGLFDTLATEFNAPGSAGSPVPVWLVRALVWRLAQLCARDDQAGGAGARGQQALFTRFLALIEAHHAEHWPVARYADRLGLTPDRLNRLARAEAGHSALAVVHERLAREACRRLTYLAAPISTIGFELGFDDPAYFTRFVRRHTGLSPRAWRARLAGDGGPGEPAPS